MKVFLNGLHLGDGKERDDFRFHSECDELVRKLSRGFKKMKLILLGDIFDLIRTQKYCEFEGLPHSEVKLKVMEDIVVEHVPFFEAFRYFREKRSCRLRYVIGNHDFGVAVDPGLLKMIRRKFGLVLTAENHYREESLGIWAEHGHRYDIINNTFNSDGTPIPYSLGDKIVVGIVNKFYERARKKQDELGIDPTILNDLDNRRPQAAVADWLDSIDDQGRLRQIHYETIIAFVINHAGALQ